MITILSIDTDWVSNQRDFNSLLTTAAPILKKTPIKKVLFSPWHKDIHLIVDSLNKAELPIRIVNIDHHHDLQYLPNELISNGFLSSNWLGHYILENIVKEVLWISNYHSKMNGFQDIRTKLIDEVIQITQDINQVGLYEYDYIFICQSPHHANTHSFCAYDALLTTAANFCPTQSKKKQPKLDAQASEERQFPFDLDKIYKLKKKKNV